MDKWSEGNQMNKARLEEIEQTNLSNQFTMKTECQELINEVRRLREACALAAGAIKADMALRTNGYVFHVRRAQSFLTIALSTSDRPTTKQLTTPERMPRAQGPSYEILKRE
jgi:hypothetical protein